MILDEDKYSGKLNDLINGNSTIDEGKRLIAYLCRHFNQILKNTKNEYVYLLLDGSKLSFDAITDECISTFKQFVGSVFYVGIGVDNRYLHHLDKAQETDAAGKKVWFNREIIKIVLKIFIHLISFYLS